jgi:aryl-alcohol dehydrogenase-like predicted oxidoreductase
MKLNDFVTLGRSGLRVSPLCLGTLTFGTDWGIGVDEAASRQLFHAYLDAGGNSIDTADNYNNGATEPMVGKFIADAKARDHVVLATKFSFNAQFGNPNAGGNGRKNIFRSLETSLRRLQTDYIDLYWLHVWDRMTPAEEVLATFDALVKSGKVRYIALSDVPAWYMTQMQTLAELQGRERVIALQLEYSLLERTAEREHIPAAQEMGIGFCPWSPLAAGKLTGKYARGKAASEPQSRLDIQKSSGTLLLDRSRDSDWNVVETLLEVSHALGRPPAEVALNWVATQPGVTSTIIGATKLSQLQSNLRALEFTIPADLRARLDAASALDPLAQPYVFFAETLQNRIRGGVSIRPWSRWDT